jgi:hypothetical protein
VAPNAGGIRAAVAAATIQVTLVGLRSLPQTVQRWFERSRRL